MRKPRLGTLLLVIWGLLLTGAVIVYLTYLQPARLGRTVSSALESSLGLKCTIREVNFSLFPRGMVIIRGLRLTPGTVRNVEFRVDSCQAELSWLSLLRLKPVLRSVDLQGPVADILWPLGSPAPAPRPAVRARSDGLDALTAPRALPILPPTFAGIHINVANGVLRVRTEDGTRNILLSGINGNARLPGLFNGTVDLAVRKSSLRLGRAPEITLDDLAFRASSLHGDRNGDLTASLVLAAGIQMDSLESMLGHPLKPAYQYFPMPRPARLETSMNLSVALADRRFSADGTAKADMVLPMNGHDTPIAITLPYTLQSLSALRVEGMDVDIDGDRAILTGEVTGLTSGAPVFTGQADVQHFSLSRWFGFGHKMTAGLQHALNDISGTLDLVLSPQGVQAPRLEARLKSVDAVLVGSGRCDNFREPDIVIEGAIASVDLNPVFPEINGEKPARPALPPPAVPLEDDGKPSKVGYDIRLLADKALIWKLEAGKVDCRITPVPLTAAQRAEEAALRAAAVAAGQAPPAPWRSGGKGVLLTIAAGDVYGGKGAGLVHVGDTDRVQATVSNVSAEAPVTRMAGYAAVGGTLQAKADLTFHGSSAAEMMGNLAGTLDATLTQGFLGSKAGTKMPYRKLSVRADAKAAPGKGRTSGDLPAAMDFSGNWKASLDTAGWTVDADSRATLTFSMRNGLPLSMASQPVNFRLRLDKDEQGNGAWPRDVTLDLKTRTAFDMNAGTLALADLSGGRTGLALGGSLRASDLFGTPVLEGRMSARTGTLRETARAFGLNLPAPVNPAMLTSLRLEADVRRTGNNLDLKNITGSLDRTGVAGSMSAVFGQRPFWTANLRLGEVDADAYWPAPSKGPATPVQTEFLRGCDLDLHLFAALVKVFDTPLINLKLPFTLKQGVFDTGVFSAAFSGGGAASGTLHGEVTAGGRDAAGRPLNNGQLSTRLQLRLNNVAMQPLTESRGQDTLLAGTGTGQLDLQANLRTWSDIPSRLDGNWSVAVRDGYLVSAKAAAEAAQQPPSPVPSGFGMGGNGVPASPTPARTPFQILSASGSLLAGVVRSDNFLLDGTMLSVRGGGVINLNTMTIDAKATATLLGVPEMPLTITGSLADPKTSYKLMGAVAGTIGNIGGTVLDIVGGVITAPFRLFMGKKTLR